MGLPCALFPSLSSSYVSLFLLYVYVFLWYPSSPFYFISSVSSLLSGYVLTLSISTSLLFRFCSSYFTSFPRLHSHFVLLDPSFYLFPYLINISVRLMCYPSLHLLLCFMFFRLLLMCVFTTFPSSSPRVCVSLQFIVICQDLLILSPPLVRSSLSLPSLHNGS